MVDPDRLTEQFKELSEERSPCGKIAELAQAGQDPPRELKAQRAEHEVMRRAGKTASSCDLPRVDLLDSNRQTEMPACFPDPEGQYGQPVNDLEFKPKPENGEQAEVTDGVEVCEVKVVSTECNKVNHCRHHLKAGMSYLRPNVIDLEAGGQKASHRSNCCWARYNDTTLSM